MKYRRSTRLPDYDYTSAGAYFVTLVTYGRECLFGDVINGEIVLNEWGNLAKNEWWRLGQRFEQVDVDKTIIMPNHIHGILCFVGAGLEYMMNSEEPSLAPPLRKIPSPGLAPGSLGAIVGAFKSTTARLINGLRHTPGALVWQRNYYDRVIRDEIELKRVREYIYCNPLNWKMDQENPDGLLM